MWGGPDPRWGSAEQAGSEGLEDRLGLGVDVELPIDVTDVEADGVLAQVQLGGGGLVAVAVGQEPEDFRLPGESR